MFDPQDLAKAFEILLVGWGGVFIVLTLIYLSSLVLTKLFPVKGDKD
jgi:hypothetical protein